MAKVGFEPAFLVFQRLVATHILTQEPAAITNPECTLLTPSSDMRIQPQHTQLVRMRTDSHDSFAGPTGIQ